jgi:hypothetical protein
MKRLTMFVLGAIVAVGLLGAGGAPAKDHRHKGWTPKQEREFLKSSSRGGLSPTATRCNLRVIERYFPTRAKFNAAVEADPYPPEFQASVDAAQQECWTGAEERMFFDFTHVDPGSRIARHARCALAVTEKAFPTYEAWHAASQESTPDGDSPQRPQRSRTRSSGRASTHEETDARRGGRCGPQRRGLWRESDADDSESYDDNNNDDDAGNVSVARTRSALYRLARFLGDYQAVKNGRVGKRIANKVIGRNVVRRLWR